MRKTLFLLLATTFLSAQTFADTPPSNPLATEDNASLDARAINIYSNADFSSEKRKACLNYTVLNRFFLSKEEKQQLNQTIDELIFSTLQKAINNDPARPKVYWVNTPPRQWFSLDVPGGRYSYDNPDCIYRTIPISDKYSYEITGHRYETGPTDIVFSLIKDPSTQRTVTYLKGSDIVLNEDGSYKITVDANPAGDRVNHIQSTSQAVQLYIRNNLGDWTHETPDYLTVTRVDNLPSPAEKTDEDILQETRAIFDTAIFAHIFGAYRVKTLLNCINTLPQPSQSATLGTLVTQAASFGHFKITKDQVLVAHVQLGEATYFVLPVTSPWTITVDAGKYQSSLNNKQAVPNDDGTLTFVISPEDPGVYNWIDTAGLLAGTMQVRWQNVSIDNDVVKPSIELSVVDKADLKNILPQETRYVTPEERQVILAERLANYQRRTQEN